jgi:virulence-associated protein VapD
MDDLYTKKMFITKNYLETEIKKQVGEEDYEKNKEDISYCFRRLKFVNRQLAIILSKSQSAFKEKTTVIV